MTEPLVLLHGFAQSGTAWDAVRARLGDRRVLAPDLRGHGTAAALRPIDTSTLVADVLAAVSGRFVLAGYSMGGRLALHVALAAPERVAALALVSTTAGIEDPGERAARRAADAALADATERDGIAAFAARWEALALWADEPPAVRARARAQRLAQDPAGLAAALRGFGTATMTPVWDRLPELTMAVAVVTGARDVRFAALGERLAALLPRARRTTVPGAGHALPLAAPEAVAAAVLGLAGEQETG